MKIFAVTFQDHKNLHRNCASNPTSLYGIVSGPVYGINTIHVFDRLKEEDIELPFTLANMKKAVRVNAMGKEYYVKLTLTGTAADIEIKELRLI
jgi:hypothetical protein